MLKVQFEASSPEEFQKMLVYFANSDAMTAELKKRGIFKLEPPKPSMEVIAHPVEPPMRPIPIPDTPGPYPVKRPRGRPPGAGKKEESTVVDFNKAEPQSQPVQWEDEAGESVEEAKPVTKDDVIVALNSYANANGGKAGGIAKIKAFCGSEKLADISVEKYGEFIESLRA